MSRIKDYIFYRTYLAYLKWDRPPKFTSTAYLILIDIFLLMPIYGVVSDLTVVTDKGANKPLFLVYAGLICFLNFRRYYRKGMVEQILNKHKDRFFNKISIWVILLILPACMVIGVTIYILAYKLIISKYHLKGYLSEFF